MRNKKAKKIKKITPRNDKGELDKNVYRKLKKHYKKGIKLGKRILNKLKNG